MVKLPRADYDSEKIEIYITNGELTLLDGLGDWTLDAKETEQLYKKLKSHFENVPPTPEALLQAIKQLDQGNGVEIAELSHHLKWDSTIFDKLLDKLKQEGLGFEPKPGRVKLL